MTAKKTTNGAQKRKPWHIDWSKVEADMARWRRVRKTPAGKLSREDLELALAMVDGPPKRREGIQERQAALCVACDWALSWWARTHDRRKGETAKERRTRLQGEAMARRELEQAEGLCVALRTLEPKAEKVAPQAVLLLLRRPEDPRADAETKRKTRAQVDDESGRGRPASPQALAFELARLGGIWPDSSAEAIRQARLAHARKIDNS